jgi:hypothetical protein
MRTESIAFFAGLREIACARFLVSRRLETRVVVNREFRVG